MQGIGGGMLVPVGTAMLYRAYPPSERARASAVLSIPSVLGPALGPVLGGVITTHTSWRFIFLINVPIGIVAFIFGLLYLKESTEPTAGSFDFRGFALSAAGFSLVIFGLSEIPRRGWSSPVSIVPTAAGLVVIAILVLYSLRQSAPMLAFRLYANRAFRSANIVGFVGMGAFIGSVFVIPLFLQLYRGLSPQESGFATFTQALGFISVSRFVGIAYMRLGPRRLMVAGLALSALINLNFLWVDEHTNLWWIRLIMFGRGPVPAPAVHPVAGERVRHHQPGGHRPRVVDLQHLAAVGVRGRRRDPRRHPLHRHRARGPRPRWLPARPPRG